MNPYLITEPAAISFSGGRTSAYMLYKILEAHDGILPPDTKVLFANTGMEMEETLRFIQDCAEQWHVDVIWLECRARPGLEGENKFVYDTVVVDFETASRKGEPFESLITARNYLPNVVARFCTSELKVRRIQDYLKTVGHESTLQYVGIRYDEPRRAAKMHMKNNDGHECYCPLFVDHVSRFDVHSFWQSQNFDLALKSVGGVTMAGNCTLCYLKGHKKKAALISAKPSLADWWIEQENRIGGRFRDDQPSYEAMKVFATDQGQLFEFDGDDDSMSCFCGD